MVATGYFEDFDFIYGFHYFSTVPTGTIDVKDGPASANSDLFRITVTGRGGHASMPADTLDPVVAAAQLVGQLQTVVSRRVAAGVPTYVRRPVEAPPAPGLVEVG